jgi:pimeloyl-ACP methyl ester carboxylesterase
MAIFVLVHGSWHGGWCWQKVVPLLRGTGHQVYTPTLTGLGARSHLLNRRVDLTTHITDVVNLLFYEDLSEVVLVGHSYAGMVITGVAARIPERLARLVFLDAYVPAEGQSEFDLWPPEEQATARADIAAGRELRSAVSPAILGITDTATADWVAARLTPHPLTTYEQPAPLGNPQSAALPRVYIHCMSGPVTPRFAPFAAKARTENWEVREIAAGHDVMLTAPEELAEILLQFTSEPGLAGALAFHS